AQRRITDIAASTGNPRPALKKLAAAYVDGDTDLAWARVTLWRGILAAALDQAPYEPVLRATVHGAADSASANLLAGWLGHRLRCPVTLVRARDRAGIVSVRLDRKSGPIDLLRPVDGDIATLSQVGQPERTLALPHRSDAECLADELRRLDPDEVYADTLIRGLPKVRSVSAAAAERASRPTSERTTRTT
ncbi:MAG: glucose-6-phosphate dehydrogenase assembly protein OpcA, partial [Nostocoides sp.]